MLWSVGLHLPLLFSLTPRPRTGEPRGTASYVFRQVGSTPSYGFEVRAALDRVNHEADGGEGRGTSTTTYRRSQTVHTSVLRRADGTCEGCAEPAPFTKRSGRPYLEPHHIRRRADGGPDHPQWVVALCPNCHCRVREGQDCTAYNEEFAERLDQLEGTEAA